MEIIHTGITLSLVAYRNLLRENVKYRSSMLLVQVRRVCLSRDVSGRGECYWRVLLGRVLLGSGPCWPYVVISCPAAEASYDQCFPRCLSLHAVRTSDRASLCATHPTLGGDPAA
jgi:hypothetical protein